MKGKLLICLLVALCISSFAITITSWSTDKSSYEPGDSGYITLNVYMAHGLATGESLRGFKSTKVESYSSITDYTQDIGDMSMSTVVVNVPLSISEDTKESLYTIPIKITAVAQVQSASGSVGDSIDTATASIPVKVSTKPVITLDVDPKSIEKSGNITLNICSRKGIAEEVSVTSSLYLDGGKVYLEKVDQNCTKVSVAYDASNFEEGSATASFNISYKDAIGDAYSTLVSIPMTVSKEASRFIINQNAALDYKKNSNLQLTLENKGSDAQDVRISPSTEINLVTKSEIEVGGIGKGGKKNITEMVYTALEPGVNSVIFTVYWNENGQEKSEKVNVPINVKSEDSMDIYLEANPSPLQFGQEHTVSIIVANKASYSISGVSVSIESDAFEVLDVEKRKFIGSINNDDFSSQQFKIRIKPSDGSENNSLKVTVQFKDPSGKDIVKEKEIPINIKEAAKTADNTFLFVVGAAVVIIIAYLLTRKKDKK
ncbi:MAG: hypothetical protein NTY68_03590 [Candidatus Micrarchaeota archaeon]|nr:hypothetical protein [Candidatus Micrarchaeota archaeon]